MNSRRNLLQRFGVTVAFVMGSVVAGVVFAALISLDVMVVSDPGLTELVRQALWLVGLAALSGVIVDLIRLAADIAWRPAPDYPAGTFNVYDWTRT
jgi:hypothetical protein